MARKESSDDCGARSLVLPMSTHLNDLREAHRHVLFHRRAAQLLTVVCGGAVLLQGTVGFYRLLMGMESRTDLIIFAIGLVLTFVIYTAAVDVPAIVARSETRKQRLAVQFASDGVRLESQSPKIIHWSSLKHTCFTPHTFTIEAAPEILVISLSQLSRSEMRRLRRFLVAQQLDVCDAHEQRVASRPNRG